MRDIVEDIKSRLPIEELVSSYVQLKKFGRSLKGLCPFHAEKSPSFVVSPDRGIAYCFGCHKGGDIFTFIQELEGVDFADALKILAERAGVEYKPEQVQKSAAQKDEKQDQYDLHNIVATFYEEKLWTTKDGEKVLAYLHKRGLTDETIKLFRVGFAPDSFDETYTYLLKKGFTKKQLVASGLASTKETTTEKIYDKFRGRLMFPIIDAMGRVVAFGGRALAKEQEPKYLNSPETILYHKSQVLYGFYQSKAGIKTQKKVLFVEGYFDMIAAFQAGVNYVVATSGTAMTEHHLRVLKPFVEEVILGFDMDNAGQEAARRAYAITQNFDFFVKVLQLPSGKDIADYVLQPDSNLGVAIDAAKTYGEYFCERLLITYGFDSPQAQRKILQEFAPFFYQLKSSLERDTYIRRFARDFLRDEKSLYDEMRNLKLPAHHPARQAGQITLDTQIKDTSMGIYANKLLPEELFIGFALEFPRLVSQGVGSELTNFLSGDLKAIYNAFFDQYNTQGTVDRSAIFALLSQETAQKAKLFSFYVAETYGEISEPDAEKEIKALVEKITKSFSLIRSRELHRQIMEAEKQGDKAQLQQLLQELQNLNHPFKA